MNDLGTKLSHLPLVQRKELAEVITQYREVFPDVPSKTNLIEHDVDVGDSAPIKQHPYRVRPLDAKIQTIAKFPIPTSRKELARFLGMVGYYRNFCLNFSEIAAPLTNLLSKKVKFVWTDDCQLAFDKVKLLLQKSPVLKSPDYEKPFKLIIDSSDVGTGSVLVQEASDGLDHPVSYFSKKFLKYQKNYSVVEKETLGLVLALEHFDVYLGSTPSKIKVYTDHIPLTFLKTMKNKNQRLVKWSLALQEYNLEIQHIPGSENVVAH